MKARHKRTEALTIEGVPFVGRVYDLALPVHLGDYDLETLERIAPDRAYVWYVEQALSRLAARVGSLNWVLDLLQVSRQPLSTPNGRIPRDIWFKACLDVLLMRLISVLDCTLIVVNEVLELRLQPHQVKRDRVERSAAVPALIRDRLEKMAAVQDTLREERNTRIHHGAERRYGGRAHAMFKTSSYLEVRGQVDPQAETLPYDDRSGTFSLAAEHRRIAESIAQEFWTCAAPTVKCATDILEQLAEDFEKRWKKKLKDSKLDLVGNLKVPEADSQKFHTNRTEAVGDHAGQSPE